MLRRIRTLDCGVPLSKRHLGDFLSKYRELHDRLSEDPSSRYRPDGSGDMRGLVASRIRRETVAKAQLPPAGATPRR